VFPNFSDRRGSIRLPALLRSAALFYHVPHANFEGPRAVFWRAILQKKTTEIHQQAAGNPLVVSFRGSTGDGESRTALIILRARNLAPLGMTETRPHTPPSAANTAVHGPPKSREQSQNVYENKQRTGYGPTRMQA
jgi:hypothetical protein